MKLRNLMYATMIACAFASCSNDDVPTPDQGGANAEGTVLSVKFDAPLKRSKRNVQDHGKGGAEPHRYKDGH